MAPIVIILILGIVTISFRLVPHYLLERIALPATIERSLKYVPAAVLAAIILPELLQPPEAPAGTFIYLSLSNLRLLAGAFAMLVAWRTQHMLLTVIAGMGALWLLSAITTG